MSAPLLRPASGPADPPSSRPHAGVLPGPVYAYTFDPSRGAQRIDVPGLDGIALTPDTVLHWAFYADGPAATLAPWAALAVTVDVRTADGSRLSDIAAVRDRYDFPLTAEGQFAARWSMPEQWNADSVALAPLGTGTGTVELVFGTAELATTPDVPAEVTGFVQVLVEERPGPGDLPPVERVDTRRGSHSGPRFSRGNTVPAVAAPHGFTFVTPATDAADARWPYRPFVHDDPQGRRLEALQFSHQPSPWIGDRAVLQLMPFFGTARSAREDRRRWIVEGSERARPHEYTADLGDGVHVEMTATSHTAAFRVRCDDPRAAVGFVIDQLTNEGLLTFTDIGFEGWIPEGPEDWGNAPRCYFAGTVHSASNAAHGALDDDGRARVAGFVRAVGAVEVRVGVSFLSVAQARHSLALEAPPAVPFDELRARAAAAWNRLLGRVTIPPLPEAERPFRGLADEEQRARIAAALHRMHLYPNTAAENTGTAEAPAWRFADVFAPRTAFGESATGAPVAEGELVVNNGYWDTYRTEWPALALLDPALAGRLLDGQLMQYRRGGWMARWSAPGYVDSMVGTSSDQIFADAARWGVPFDREAAFESGWRDACEPGPDPRRGRKGIGRGRFLGFIPSDVPEGMSWSIENAVSDAALGRFAAQLAASTAADGAARYRAFARYFANRSRAARALFDPASGFFRGRTADGSFAPDFDPRVWGGDNVETNAWGMSVGTVHDGRGLAALHGGPAGLGRHLDALFAEPETADERFGGAYGTVIHEQREARAQRSGMCALSNQPAHHLPFMYAFTDRPWHSAGLVHGLARRLFAGAHIGQGFPGDEDNGEMSAWWLWAALGLYPLELAAGTLRIGSPLSDDIRVARGDGTSLRIRSRRSSPAAHVLEDARLDGRPLPTADLPIDALRGDAVLDLVFGTDPARALESGEDALDAEPWRCDLTADAGEIVASADVLDAPRLFDDGDPQGDAGVRLPEGSWVGWRFPSPRGLTDITVTSLGPTAADALRWEMEGADGAWHPLATRHREDLAPDRTTPFTLEMPVVTPAIRVRATVEVTLRQVELFDLG
ncbi:MULTISPECIES: GH92 family glycosyl hydrolase [unclassified Microbacterium]|uniref:GH92 family glycosyl hydrolase n=1 Tax=unclassified Microbacterium TaxID=2609290 RepID=UPI0021A558B9|nr:MULTISPECIES: GH92 family glycosyl hydrolase [unclassified Microbacterium]MCT1364939.1 GH92 family glycosyl hydrolase [Microbacterium sp. p3-SID131]MCT1375877.1 GH92 family glycosyl hydrolase [Microbacterium sp. p3-SID337]